jgi:hypothetical protein
MSKLALAKASLEASIEETNQTQGDWVSCIESVARRVQGGFKKNGVNAFPAKKMIISRFRATLHAKSREKSRY